MGSIYRWLNERLDLRGIKRVLLDREVPDRLTWWHTLGSATFAVFLVLALTGIVLATFYSPSPDHAYDSVRYVQTQVAGGALLRGIHRWSASMMVVLVLAHMLRVFAVGAYKYPREANWLLGTGLFLVVMGFAFTGYLLPWDQKAYWATQVGTSMAGTVPIIGGALVTLLRGGAELGAATLARFYAFHVLWLPATLLGLVGLHLALVIRQGIAPRPGALEEGSPKRTTDPSYPEYYERAYAASKREGVRFWPDILGKDALVATLVVAVIVILAATFGAGLEPPADPTDSAYVPRPEWYFLPLYQLLTMVPGSLESVVAIGVPTVIVLVLLALPFVDRRSPRNLLHRPFSFAVLVLVVAGSGLLVGKAVRETPPEIVAEVDRPLTSRERTGKAIYKRQQCGSCHTIAGEGGAVGPDLTEVGLRFSNGWLHSFIENPRRFRPAGFMPSYGPPELTHQQVENLALYLSSLRGAGGPEVQPVFRDTFPP